MQQSSNICASCGYINRRGVLFCEECAHSLSNTTNETIPGSETSHRIREVVSHARMNKRSRFERETLLLLHIRNEAEPLAVSVGASRLVIGRIDHKMGRMVDIDLTTYGALRKGVSRQHAVLYREKNDYLYLQDTDSVNGTFLNGTRLRAWEAYPIKDGDEITFGNLRTHAYFETPAITSTRS